MDNVSLNFQISLSKTFKKNEREKNNHWKGMWWLWDISFDIYVLTQEEKEWKGEK